MRKLLHPVGVIFKGSGFYNTDYRRISGNGSKSETDGAEKPKDGAAPDAKSAEPKTAESSKPHTTSPSKTGKRESSGKPSTTTAKD